MPKIAGKGSWVIPRDPIVGWLLLVGGLCATASASADIDRGPGRFVERVETVKDPGQLYALYLPSDYDTDRRDGASDRVWPVLFVLDPRGRAVPGVDRFRAAAERHGWIVLSSYQSRSDTLREVNYEALNALLLDAQTRYAVDTKRFYLAGMSGTAHASWRFAQALEENVAGVIAAVGGVQTSTQGPPGEAEFSYYGITATADFNYQETMELEEHLLDRAIDHRIRIFEGRHGWPPEDYTHRAVDWMELQAIKRGLAPLDEELIDSELAAARAARQAATDPLEQLRRARDIVRDFAGLRDVDADAADLRRLEADRRIADRRKQEKKLARAEAAYMKGRVGGWLVEMSNPEGRPPSLVSSLVTLRVESLQERAAAASDPYDAHSARRSLDNLYVQVAFYLPRQYEKSGDLERLIRCLEIAIEIYPDRPRDHWRLAAAYAESGRERAALSALERAVSFGGVDLDRLKSDATWERLREHPDWDSLVAIAAREAG